MLCRKRSDYLLKAIQAYTFNKQNNIAAGLKSALYYLLKKFATIVKSSHLPYGSLHHLAQHH